MGMWTYEREQWKNGVQTVCGVDEAGAGPLMGPCISPNLLNGRMLCLARSFCMFLHMRS